MAGPMTSRLVGSSLLTAEAKLMFGKIIYIWDTSLQVS